jgi:hypothetical protein
VSADAAGPYQDRSFPSERHRPGRPRRAARSRPSLHRCRRSRTATPPKLNAPSTAPAMLLALRTGSFVGRASHSASASSRRWRSSPVAGGHPDRAGHPDVLRPGHSRRGYPAAASTAAGL